MPFRLRGAVFPIASLLVLIALGAPAANAAAAPQTTETASWVGPGVCADCHEDLSEGFERTVHGRLATWELNDLGGGCEACHGPGGLHVESGEVADIRSFSALSADQSADACLACHSRGVAMEWAGGVHAMAGVACSDCHSFHEPRQALVRTVPTSSMIGYLRTNELHSSSPPSPGAVGLSQTETCLKCHSEVRSKFQFSSHHPVLEGLMECSGCHLADGAIHGNTPTIDRTNDLCTECHATHEGPWVFEHPPVEEDCLSCHSPHGSVANSLLAQNEPFLCLQCHEQHFHAARLGLPSAGSNASSGLVENSNGTLSFIAGFNSKCTACHPAIHGSDLPSLSITGGGKALIR